MHPPAHTMADHRPATRQVTVTQKYCQSKLQSKHGEHLLNGSRFSHVDSWLATDAPPTLQHASVQRCPNALRPIGEASLKELTEVNHLQYTYQWPNLQYCPRWHWPF